MDTQGNNIFEQYAELVKRFKAGDDSAFKEIYENSQKMVYVTCFGILNNEQDAEDAMQETYITAYQKIDTLTDENTFLHWLKTIAANKARDKFKSRKDNLSIDDVTPDEAGFAGDDDLENLPDSLILEKDKRDTFYKIMREELSQDQFQTVLLFYYDELPVADIAKIMECPENTIKTKLWHARAKIKKGIENYEKTNNISLMGGIAGAQTLGNFFRSYYGQFSVPALKGLPFMSGTGSAGTAGTAGNMAIKEAGQSGGKIGSKAVAKAAAGKTGRSAGKILALAGASVLGIAVLGGGTFAVIKATAKKEPEKIELIDYFSCHFSGYDGEGTVTYSIDFDGIIDDCENLEDLRASKLERKIRGSFDRSEDLSNGDKIVFEWDTDLDALEEEYNVEFIYDDIDVNVFDLVSLPALDPFESFSISFAGVSTDGYVTNYSVGTNTEIGYVSYILSAERGLSNGDVITVTAIIPYQDINDVAREAHYRISRETMEVTVEGLDEYVKSTSEITDDFVQSAQDRAISLYKGDHAWTMYDSIECKGVYFLSGDDNTEHKNIYFVVLSAKRTFVNPDVVVDQYYYVCFYDLIRHNDGTMDGADMCYYDRSYGTEISFYEPYGITFEAEGHTVMGYPDFDSLYADAIQPLLSAYSCEAM